ncbi:hypothetical protein [Legionella gresilensis]|uniref:hypothetical protein n=1 Tax=Legionella gresilensis TaxID=91823 RepID=UPI001041442B|nr:hypothetical protein [Legionella gresilensis]
MELKFEDAEKDLTFIWNINVVGAYKNVMDALALQSKFKEIGNYMQDRMSDYCRSVTGIVNQLATSMPRYDDKTKARDYLLSTIEQAKTDLIKFLACDIANSTKEVINHTFQQLSQLEGMCKNMSMPTEYKHTDTEYTSIPTRELTSYHGTFFEHVPDPDEKGINQMATCQITNN